METKLYTCPVCGYLIFFEPAGSDDICSICFWHDDLLQLEDPAFSGGANDPSLIQAQKNYQIFGAKEERVKQYVRKPTKDDKKDPKWFPIESKDQIKDIKNLYYWDETSEEIDPDRLKYRNRT